MSSKFKLCIVTPQRRFFDGEVTELSTITEGGSIGILAEHIPFVGLLTPTVTTFKLEDGTVKTAFTSTGLLKVEKSNVELIVDASEWPEEIDIRRAEEAKDRAEGRINKAATNNKVDVTRAEIALERALARLKIKGM